MPFLYLYHSPLKKSLMCTIFIPSLIQQTEESTVTMYFGKLSFMALRLAISLSEYAGKVLQYEDSSRY